MVFKKGIKSWNSGKSSWAKGKHFTENHKKKISKAVSGKNNWMYKIGVKHPFYGKHHQESSKLKMSTKLKGRKVWNKNTKGICLSNKTSFKKGNISLFKGKHHTLESIRKMQEQRAKQMPTFQDTKIEVIMQNFLKKLNIEFIPHYYINDIKHKYRCDIFVPLKNLVIECDGNYFHGHPDFYPEDKLTQKQKDQKKRDHTRTKELQDAGYKVMRLWESEILANKDMYELPIIN